MCSSDLPPPGGTPPQPPQYQQPTQPQYQQPQYQQPTQPQYQQPYPGQQYPPQQYGQFPQGAPPVPPKKKTGLIIAIAAVVVAAVVGAVLILSGGDDDKTVKPTDSTPVVVPTNPDDTILLTVPQTTGGVAPTVAPVTTLGGTDGDGFPVTDDTGMMTVFLPAGADYDTSSAVDGEDFLPRVIASNDVEAFVTDDVTQGLIVLGVPSTYDADENDVIDVLSPAGGTCGIQTPGAPMQTPFGMATVVLLDACGPGGAYSKVIMGVTTNGTLVAIGVYLQGEGPAVDMLDTA